MVRGFEARYLLGISPAPAIGCRPNGIRGRLTARMLIAATFCRPARKVGGSGGRVGAGGNVPFDCPPTPDLLRL
jgi:hypothetical protein